MGSERDSRKKAMMRSVLLKQNHRQANPGDGNELVYLLLSHENASVR